MMKKLFLLFFMFVLALTVMAQSTQKITYQAVVRDGANRLVVNTPVKVDVTITYSSGSYFESLKDTTNANGLMYVLIGGNPGFESINWENALIKTVVTIDGRETVTDEVAVTAVPYALQANYADSVNVDVIAHYIDSHALTIETDPTVPAWAKESTKPNYDYSEIQNTPDLTVYATNVHLNDTLSYYYTDKKINDTLSHYLTQEVQVLSVSNDTLYLTGGSWVKLPKGFSGDYNDLTNRPDLTVYATNVHLDDTLSYYFDTTQVKTAIHDTADAIRAAIPAQVNADWNATSGKAEILNKPTIPTTVAELSDAANYTTNAHLNDTLSHYYDTTQVNQTLKQYLKSGNLCDSVMRCTAIQAMQNDIVTNTTNIDVNKHAITDSSAHIRNDIKNGKITIALISGTETGVTNPTFGVNQDTNQTVTINIPEAATVNNGQLTIIAAGDTTRFTANQATNDTVRLNKFATKDTLKNFVNKLALRDSVNNIVKDSLAAPNSAINMAIDTIARHNISDSTRMVFDTLHKYYATKDTLKNFVNKLAIRDSVNNIVKDSLAAPNSAINLAIDTIARHNISDSTRMVFDTLHKYYATKDTLKNFVNKLALRDSVNNIVKDSLAAPNSAINMAIDTIARYNISDSTRMVFDTLHKYYATNAHLNDTLKYYTTSKQIDTLLGAYATKIALRDSTKMVFDTLHKYYATKDTLKNFVNKLALRDSVNNIVKDSLAAPNSAINLAIDTIARHNISDSTRMVFDTLHKYYATNAHLNDTLKYYTTSKQIDTLLGAYATNAHLNDTLSHYYDSTHVKTAIHDTATAIRALIPTVPENIAITTADNAFSGNNNFTGTNTVPRGFVIKGENATNGDNCNNIVVNACDLWAVFDSLTKRMNAMQKAIDGLRDSIKTFMPKLSLVANPTSGVVCGEKPATITYTANISNGNTAEYQFKWTVNETDSTNVTGPTLTCRFTNAGEYKAVCTATSTGRYTLKDSVTLTVTAGTPPVFSTNSNDLHLTLTSTSASDIDSIAWGDNNGKKNPTIPAEHEYSTSGTYTITVFSTTGCKEEKEVTVKVGIETDKLTPCNVTAHTDNTIYTATTGGLETTNENGAVTMVQDQDGHEYYVTQIGSQCWMAENLRSTKYSSSLTGTLPNLHELPSQASTFIVDTAYYGYPNDNFTNYGLVYTWIAAMGGSSLERSQGICPDGWHVPSQSDFTTMRTSASAHHASGRLSGGMTGTWTSSSVSTSPGDYNYEYRNESGFSALPAGICTQGDFEDFGTAAYFWTSTHQGYGPSEFGGRPTYYFLTMSVSSSNADFYDNVGVENCISLRCVRDEDGSSAPIAPTVSTTSPATDITSTSATLSGTYSANGNTISEKGFEWAVSGYNYTKKTVSGDELTCSLTGLTPSEDYVFRAYIISNGVTYYGTPVEFTTTLPCGTSNIIDASGNSYEIVLIGSQCWTKTNLRTTKKRNGDDLTLGAAASSEDDAYYFKPVSSEEWKVTSSFSGAEVVPFSSYNDSVFGYYYNWPAAAGEGNNSICPKGWHVPSIDDWNTLMTYLSTNATYYSCDNDPIHIAKALSYTTYWKSTEMDCSPGYIPSSNNESGFSAIPAGYHNTDYTNYGFYDAGYVADFWSSTQYYEENIDDYWGRYVRIRWQESGVDKSGYWKDTGKSVRCVKDDDGGGGGGTSQTDPTVTTDAVTNKGETSATMNATITNDDNVSITNKGFEYKLTVGGTYENFEGTITETTNGFTANLTNLTANTSYTYKAFITFNNETVYGSEVTFTTDQAAGSFTCGTSKVRDADDNEYNTMLVGTGTDARCWMAENLRTKHYSQAGTPTLKIVDEDASYNTAYYAYPNNQSSNESQYGLLYNFYAVMGGQTSYTNAGSQGICPDEWHVPTNSELNSLLSSPPTQFAGQLIHDGMDYYFSYSGIDASCYLWSSSQDNTLSPYYLISNGDASINAVPFEYKFNCYFSVRCVRDAESGGGSENAPTASSCIATRLSTNGPGISVAITGIDLKGTTAGTIDVKYKCYGNCLQEDSDWIINTYDIGSSNDTFYENIQINNEGMHAVQILLSNGGEPVTLYDGDVEVY